MFALRLIQETRESELKPFEQVIETHELGSSYALLKKGETKEFEKVLSNEKYDEFDKTKVRAIICGENGSELFVENRTELENNTYYILNDRGEVFEQL